MIITDDAMKIIRTSGIDVQEVIELFGCFEPRQKSIPVNWKLFYYNGNGNGNGNGNINCSICLEENVNNGYKLICEHIFHVHCLTNWAKINHNCPNCRMKF